MQRTNPPFFDPSMWTPWPPQQQQPYQNQWNPNWRGQQPPFSINYLNHNFCNHSPYHQVLHQTIK
jgi:hypothetical protein